MLPATCSTLAFLPAASLLPTTDGGCPTSRIAYIHVPKAAGVSLFAALDGTSVPVCNHGTSLRDMGLHHEPCQCTECGARSHVAVAEQTHAWMRHTLFDEQGWGGCAVWAALVREPREWFYSAVGQWCAGLGGQQHHPACETDSGRFANVSQLRSWGFFEKNGAGVEFSHRRLQPGEVKYYFQAPNLQSLMLGGALQEPDHIVCALPQRARLLEAIRGLVGGAPPLAADAHANEAHWDRIDEWRAAVPWSDVEEFYREDQRLWDRVSNAPGGCVLTATRSRLAQVVPDDHDAQVKREEGATG